MVNLYMRRLSAYEEITKRVGFFEENRKQREAPLDKFKYHHRKGGGRG